MNYFENKNFNMGLILIFLAGGISSCFMAYWTIVIIAAVMAIIGFAVMLKGIRQLNQKGQSDH